MTSPAGPSPRRRGNPQRDGSEHDGTRTIPAQAGEPAAHRTGASAVTDHPRAGGGTHSQTVHSGTSSGPSPRRRGNLSPMISVMSVMRTIPAQAGEPEPVGKVYFCSRDHPRAGGGTSSLHVLVNRIRGPSPRRRGNPVCLVSVIRILRTIPAQAGEPTSSSSRCASRRDHPRAGGGTPRHHPATQQRDGPSPRRRGNRL